MDSNQPKQDEAGSHRFVMKPQAAATKRWSTLSLTSTLLWCALGFLAAQRFSLSFVAGYLCLVPFTLALLHFSRDTAIRNTMLLLALFWSTDNAVLGYGATYSLVRYMIYIVAILAMVQGSTLHMRGMVSMLLLSAMYLVITVFNLEAVSVLQLTRDTQIMVLLIIVLGLSPREAPSINYPILLAAMFGYLMSENVNFFLFRSVWYGQYMSYDTTKFLIVLPSIICIKAGRTLTGFLLTALTLPVLVGYTSRTLFLCYVLAVVYLFSISKLHQGTSKRLMVLVGLLIVMIVAYQLNFINFLASYKTLNMINVVKLHGIGAIYYLDPIRFTESQIFFQRPILNLLFGSGFGSGIYDGKNLLGFVNEFQTAFSSKELYSRFFYNFHDIWVDVGQRFGLLPFGAFCYWLIAKRPRHDRSTEALWVVALIGTASAFFGTAGLVATFLLIRCTMVKAS